MGLGVWEPPAFLLCSVLRKRKQERARHASLIGFDTPYPRVIADDLATGHNLIGSLVPELFRRAESVVLRERFVHQASERFGVRCFA
jgi:hypothetical protein